MDISLINEEKQFDELKNAWMKLQSEGTIKDITVTWEWMRTWWEVFKDGRELAVLVGSEGDEVLGIAPFVRRDMRYLNLLRLKRLEFIASGEDQRDEICSNYLDFIIAPGREEEFFRAIFEFLNDTNAFKWDEVVLSQMNSDSPVMRALDRLSDEYDLRIEEIKRTPCTYALLPSSLEEYIAQLGRRTRKQIRRDMNRLSEMGDVTYKVAETEEEVKRQKETLIDLHQARWTRDGKPGAFSSTKFRKFHDIMISLAHKNQWLRLGVLSLGEKELACEYNFKYMDKIYSYQSGVDIFQEWNISIGTIADVYAIGSAISEKAATYDFFVGASEYKTRLGKQRREIVAIRISKPSLRGSALRAALKCKDIARRILRSNKRQGFGWDDEEKVSSSQSRLDG